MVERESCNAKVQIAYTPVSIIGATSLDTVGGFAVALAVAEKHAHETAEQIVNRFGRFGTIDLRVDYLRPGIGARFYAGARVVRLGGGASLRCRWS